MATRQTDHRKGVLLMVSAALCWSLSGILVRKVSVSNPWEIVFWRSAFMTLFMLLVLSRWHGLAAVAKIRAVGRAGIFSGALLASMFFSGFVLRIEEFQPAVQVAAYVLPVTHGIALLQDLMLTGSMTHPWQLVALGGIAFVLLTLSWLLLRRELRPA